MKFTKKTRQKFADDWYATQTGWGFYQRLAVKWGVSRQVVAYRVKVLRQEGYIKGHRARPVHNADNMYQFAKDVVENGALIDGRYAALSAKWEVGRPGTALRVKALRNEGWIVGKQAHVFYGPEFFAHKETV